MCLDYRFDLKNDGDRSNMCKELEKERTITDVQNSVADA